MPSSYSYTLSLHDALPISYVTAFVFIGLLDFSGPVQTWLRSSFGTHFWFPPIRSTGGVIAVMTLALYPYVYLLARNAFLTQGDRKSTRLNSSHSQISYAVFLLLHSFPTRRSSDLVRNRVCFHRPVGLFRSSPNLAEKQFRHALLVSTDSLDRRSDRGYDIGVIPLCLSACAQRILDARRSEEHTSELQSQSNLVCRLPTPTLFPYTTLFRSRT